MTDIDHFMSSDHTRFYRGNSMRTTFRLGDRLLIEPICVNDVRLGDIVVYCTAGRDGEKGELAHRVVARRPDGLVARGDNNRCADTELVSAENLVGRVTHIERNGISRPVRGGHWGFALASSVRFWRTVGELVKCLGRMPYGWLRYSDVILRFWHPAVTKVHIKSNEGVLVKYIYSGRTVARWWPESGRFECDKPFDLVIPRPDTA